MSRRSPAAGGNGPESSETPKDAGQDKQKILLSADTGHFSLIRALHLADFITELNGFCGGKFSATIIDLDHLESAEKAYNYI
ncbi:hypothetical protein H112_08484 [Trichophyton rubrum D6]|uniref:Uncharacterized protein n=2 Tax=Trichophyton TaxID=5550 RepID=A0A080WQJ5_TRIRC|nr:uncharacterized protein TERG_11670 [Trichophyton rubrum CBS 118892]EZF10294.1 hypothetical protein H100_08506 [Trichophyton rubrum MR850]EZF37186.1 hypothetical protein H102_08466 [Trichophyton rubrum CBS 100081]EZF58538.1 hypothetical protein H104_08441 [Trichophyton rubrum CBS 289.86]EZF68944.1 hypothetical protein H105_08494 [Trichophyton soudanense CBS 452.61]EZF79666.1 hypothetical protein H110_08491 [Trichophyton rubrum MR1448]EZF90355.1 hypothetical protein H113_08560 [Trichophyton 